MFSSAFSCFLIVTESTTRFQDILEVGAAGDEATASLGGLLLVCGPSSPCGGGQAHPSAPEPLPRAFYQRKIISRVAFFSSECERKHKRILGLTEEV